MKPYYLVASLPTLVLGDPAPLDVASFLAACANLLSEEELAEVTLMLEGRVGESGAAFAKDWLRVDTQLRNAVARVRAGKRSAEARSFLREHEGYDVSLEKAVTDAYTRPNPLERELFLDRHRWQRLDELVLAEPFGFAAVLAYALKLRLVLRWADLNDEAGGQRLTELLKELDKSEGKT
ncbi:MAG TPA: DUF2764 family protein [Kiritimatiellia bacterium]|nr:DUF2764 family protein [Kiritimatiellia bacterium]HRZ11118.1 DUF2764 family protein [Kiritimatiellia bacterium]HSA19510.1 DUF2764 family protein [Kiritimatiellia bacterium]